MRVFGVTGSLHSGKDAFYQAVRAHAPAVLRRAFGDDLKAEVATACGVTVDYINAHKETFRPILQWWGTDFRRRLHGEDYWIRKMAAALATLPAAAVVFITDVRFPNEAALVRAHGGRVVRIVRRNYTPPAAALGHASETAMAAIVADDTLVAESAPELQRLAGRWCRAHRLA